MPAKVVVRLTDEQRDRLDAFTRTGTRHVRAVQHARVLLLADEADDGAAWDDERIAAALACSPATVARTRKRFCAEGLDEALRVRKAGPGRPPKIDGTAEAHLIALACSEPPEGRARWTVRLLADRFVTLGLDGGWLDAPVSYETVRGTLKKTRSGRTTSPAG
jgi:transposase